MIGRMLDERLGKLHFWLTFIGFHTTFLVQHWVGDEGMPRRYADYLPSDGFTTLNVVSTIGAFTLGISTLPFLWNVFRSYRYGEVVTVDDPWGFGNSLEWATSSPPPNYNFAFTPVVYEQDAWWDMKQHGYQRPLKGYEPIHMPLNTGAGVILSVLSLIWGFAMIWHMWPLAIISFAAIVIGAIIHTFNYKRDYHIPASEVTASENARTELLARHV